MGNDHCLHAKPLARLIKKVHSFKHKTKHFFKYLNCNSQWFLCTINYSKDCTLSISFSSFAKFPHKLKQEKKRPNKLGFTHAIDSYTAVMIQKICVHNNITTGLPSQRLSHCANTYMHCLIRITAVFAKQSIDSVCCVCQRIYRSIHVYQSRMWVLYYLIPY